MIEQIKVVTSAEAGDAHCPHCGWHEKFIIKLFLEAGDNTDYLVCENCEKVFGIISDI